MVRLLSVWNGSGPGFQPSVLSECRFVHGNAVRVRDLCRRIHRAPLWRPHLRTLWRPARTQIDARHLAADHGRGYVRHRASPDLPQHRRPGANLVGSDALRARHRRWGRVGRRSVDVCRALRWKESRLSRQLASDGSARRVAPLYHRFQHLLICSFRGTVSRVGFAPALPAQRSPDRSRAFHSAANSGNSRFPASEKESRFTAATDWRLATELPAQCIARHGHALRRKWDLLYPHGLCSELRRILPETAEEHDADRCHTFFFDRALHHAGFWRAF